MTDKVRDKNSCICITPPPWRSNIWTGIDASIAGDEIKVTIALMRIVCWWPCRLDGWRRESTGVHWALRRVFQNVEGPGTLPCHSGKLNL